MQFWKEGFKNILICIKWYVLEYMWNLHSWQLERQHLFKALQKKKKHFKFYNFAIFFKHWVNNPKCLDLHRGQPGDKEKECLRIWNCI